MKLKKPLIIFDLETTGVSPVKDRIVQIGAIKVNPDGTREEKDLLINPEVEMKQDNIDIHGITNEMVKDKPPFRRFAKAILKWFSGCDLGGYNTDGFDIPFLHESFIRCGLEWDLSDCNFVDSLKIERIVNAHNLGETYKRYFGKEMDGQAHNALVDSKATLEVFFSANQETRVR